MTTTWFIVVAVCIATTTAGEPGCYAPDYCNDLINVTMTSQREALANSTQCSPSGPCGHTCCPIIVKPSCISPPNVSSVIESYSGYRANAAIITAWGNCPTKNGFFWWVDWGDGTKSYGDRDVQGPYQEVHTYYGGCYRSYLVVAAYCAIPHTASQHPCCDYYCRRIDVHA
ncbi:uncharacterized protein LOC134179908 [Corticium candelabrum]|uniref:uncharacterized protein LOC134179908 n=1 Tax=Corticium candelabrum TaxID=121492 RepID=UPI002E25AF7E|nr:uncharacterized protein LOC134179908 [Corticium candelabrum]